MADKVDYDLTEAEANLLATATENFAASVGARAGAIGGAIGGGVAGAAGGRSGGASGGRFGARFTRVQTAISSTEADGDPAVVRERVRSTIADSGYVIEDPNQAGDGSVWGLVGSGAMDMTPALVRVGIDQVGSGRSLIRVRATGREGLIKQKIGEKAADRICGAVSASEPR